MYSGFNIELILHNKGIFIIDLVKNYS